MATIETIKWTAIWVATAPDQLLGRGLGTSLGWAQRYDEVAQKTEQELAYPWSGPGQRFWSYYLGTRYQTIDGGTAWRRLVPLRVRGRPPITSESAEGVTLDVFLWPHAVGAAVTLTIDVGGSPAESADVVVSAARDHDFELPADVFGVSRSNVMYLLRQAVAQHLDRREVVAEEASVPASPFIVATVVEGYASARATPELRKGVWRSVHALADPSRGWKSVGLPPAERARVTSRTNPDPAGGGLYGVPRGRVVWQPERFSADRSARFDGLRCYHRNLVALALQVDAHLGLVKWAQPNLGTRALSFDADNLVRWSATSLSDLHAGNSTTYRSASARRHIEEDDFGVVRAVWAYYGING